VVPSINAAANIHLFGQEVSPTWRQAFDRE
jgi:hypothetical protein